MKTKLITNLKKNVLLVDGRIFDYELFKHGIYIKDENEEKDFIEDNWQLLGKLKDLTEEQCEPLVEIGHGWMGMEIFISYINGWEVKTAKESFLSALEAENVLFENPMGDSIPELNEDDLWDVDEQDSQVMSQLNYDIEKWQEAEQNVFSQETLVFVEQ